MKTVGKQLQEARLAKNWTPELAARETKIKVDRLRDLEADDFTHFNNATYARGFVRTYARALGLDEYQILRQLDNKLPDDDTANIVSAEGGVAYLPETAMPPRVAHRDFTALYVVLGLGAVVAVVIAFVLFRAYQVGELGRWTGSTDTAASDSTNSAPATAGDDNKRALPIDSNTPPPIPQPAATNAVVETAPADTNAAPIATPVVLPASGAPPRALPVDPTILNADNVKQVPPPPRPVPVAPKALPVDPSTLNANAPPIAPKALPVDPADLNGNTPPPPKALPVNPADLVAANNTPNESGQPLVLTASRDSFVRVTMLDTASGDKQIYAAVLKGGRSIGFNGHRFSVTVDKPSAVDVTLDSVNYGPHSDGSAPETFTVVSHVQ